MTLSEFNIVDPTIKLSTILLGPSDISVHSTVKDYVITGVTPDGFIEKHSGLEFERTLKDEDSFWELEQDVDPLKIQQILGFRSIPPIDKLKPKWKPQN
ncbi:hypothetical protein FQA39_LY00004 [Lamprigera yunnana]|nr:hypothetical protein FQA39_LY00004 [Lamprigera yunnana]